MAAAQEWNAEFGIAGHLRFRDDPGGLVLAEIDNAHATATLCLQGGHLMQWQPKNQAEPVIWLSRDATLASGKSIRGGVPVCWPWFGPHANDATLPTHGFVRTLPWSVVEAAAEAGGATRLSLRPVRNAKADALWHADLGLKLTIIVGVTLRLELTTHNASTCDAMRPGSLVISEALHTYLRIGDIAAVRLAGLEGCEYVDKVDGNKRKREEGKISFSGETDRVFTGIPTECVVEDERLQRRIRIVTTGSASTVVWTPWTERAAKMGDLGQPDGWREMLCVEAANALDDAVNIPSGGDHTLTAEYVVEAM